MAMMVISMVRQARVASLAMPSAIAVKGDLAGELIVHGWRGF
jgi:hypothetical protein